LELTLKVFVDDKEVGFVTVDPKTYFPTSYGVLKLDQSWEDDRGCFIEEAVMDVLELAGVES
jgi:hypothetical protein